ncbi:DegT/DnrJ/EryC1/StrS family aminotransferase [Aurantimicrobium minutum]|uniref:DegT/DnrJ/EryC1/StrS family aminotransferase n=1 Tax=Aurantimicrobium minutum TaxID=708131 RepID=UPI002476C900|nr:aminotransferase class V-fold PLP-dependent enzyme [Aurantimicrobium minutum]MDH6239032.1 aminotransferase EvaB [Aurantimicrobium minutum]
MGEVIQVNNLFRAIQHDRDSLTCAINSVFDSGRVVLGEQVASFENELAEYLKVPNVVSVASGTDALEIAIKISMPKGKSTVLSAANAGAYSAIAARRAGFNITFADVDKTTACLTWGHIQEALNDDVGVVVMTHLYGLLTDISEIAENCKKKGISLVEDCAQSLGANIGGFFSGSFGDIATTSFYPTKNLGALGDGGAIFTANEQLSNKARQLRQYGWSKKYEISSAGGVNSRLDEIQAAFLRIRLPQLDSNNEVRRQIINSYIEAAENSALHVFPADGPNHSGHLAVLVTENREELRQFLSEEGISTEIHFPIPDYKQVGLMADPHKLPNTEWLCNRILTLPCYPELLSIEIEKICQAIRTFNE